MVPLVPSDPSAPASPGGGVRISGGAERQLKIARNVVHGNFFILNKLHSSLYCLKGHHPIRRQLFDVIDGVIFNRIIGAFILLNVVCTILDTPGWRDLNGVEDFLYACDICFQVVFTLEMFTKIAALGFALHRHSFLRAPQNAVDMLLVVIGFAQFITSNTLVKQLLRLTRSLRAFAYLTRFPLLRSIFVALRQAAAPLRDVLLLMCFIILSMAVLGLQLFSGTMHNRCYLNTPLFSANGSIVPNATQWVIDPNFASMPCSTTASIGFNCPTPGSVCDRHDDVFYFRYRNFDYIWTSTYAVFKFVTLDNWPSDIQYIQAANGVTYFFFGLVIVLFGSYFALNLVLAILSGEFENVSSAEQEKDEHHTRLREELMMAQTGGAKQLQEERQNVVADAVLMVTALKMTDGAIGLALNAEFGLEIDKSPSETAAPEGNPFFQFRRLLWGWVVRSKWFLRFSLLVTVVNIVILATDHYGIDDTWDTVNSWINFVCALWFLLEAAIKILAMGLYYFRDPFNDFDFALCAISIVEISISGVGNGSSASALRAFRLARVLRVVNTSPRVRQLLLTVANAGYEASLLFVFLVMYITAGALFSVIVYPDAIPTSSRPNFSNFLNGVLATFLIISGENWNDDVAAVMKGFHPAIIAFWIPYFILATYIIINFVVVILINSFNSAKDDVILEDDAKLIITDAVAQDMLTDIQILQEAHPVPQPLLPTFLATEDSLKMTDMSTHTSPQLAPRLSGASASDPSGEVFPPAPDAPGEENSPASNALSKPEPGSVLALGFRKLNFFSVISLIADFFGIPRDPEDALSRAEGRSFMLFDVTNPFRRFCVLLVSHPLFELLAMLVVLESCVALALDNKDTRNDGSYDVFFDFNTYLTVAFFTVEFMLRCVAFGVFIGQHAFFRSLWNVADFLILIFSVIAIFLPVKAAQAVRVFRLGTRIRALRIILESLVTAIPGIANIILLVFFFYFVAGIVCVQIFKGRFASCTDASVTTKALCVGNATTTATAYNLANGTFYPYQATTVQPRFWNFAFYNFNHLGQAYLSMLYLQFSDGWSQLLFYAMDSNSDTDAMTLNNTWWWAILICYLFMQNNYFLNNLFVGSLMDSFSAEREKATGKIDATGRPLLSEEQERWIREYRFAKATSLPRLVPKPENAVRRFCAWLYFADKTRVEPRKSFDYIITFCIVINVIIMMTQFDGQPDSWANFLFGANIFFAAIFAIEFIIKIIAMTPIPYFAIGWNAFDFLLLVAAFFSIFFNGPGTNAVRVFRVARVLRLVRRAKGLYRLFESLVFALPQLFNIVILMLLVLFVFGVIGVQLFDKVYYDDSGDTTLGPFFNFHNILYSMMLLFQIATTESWGSVLQACLVNEQNSPCKEAQGNCGTAWGYPYFLIYMVIANSVCINLFVFVVVGNFEEVSQLTSRTSQYLLFRLDSFRRYWARLDSNRDGVLPWEAFVIIVRQMHVNEAAEMEQFARDIWDDDDDEENEEARRLEADVDEIASDSEKEDDDITEPERLGRPTTSDFRNGHIVSLLSRLVGLQTDEEMLGNARPNIDIKADIASDAFFLNKVKAMSIPVGDGGVVLYEDCLLGITKEFYNIAEGEYEARDESSGGAEQFLKSIVDYDRFGVFKVHHALATTKIRRAFAARRRRRRVQELMTEVATEEGRAAEHPPPPPMESGSEAP